MTGRSRPRRQARAGVTLVEVLVALVLGAVLIGAAASLMGTLSRAVMHATGRWDRLEAVRTTWVVTQREVQPGLPGRDWRLSPQGVLELRAFRGFGRLCGAAAEPGVHPVAWRGDRQPVADRDSLLVLGTDGGWRPAALTRWSPAAEGGVCGEYPGERAGWMSWAGAGSEAPVLVRLFERGAYSFHRGAFRYERGGAGRQPLTPEVFGSGSRYAEGDEASLVLIVESRGIAGARSSAPFEVRVRSHEQSGAGAPETGGGGR